MEKHDFKLGEGFLGKNHGNMKVKQQHLTFIQEKHDYVMRIPDVLNGSIHESSGSSVEIRLRRRIGPGRLTAQPCQAKDSAAQGMQGHIG